MNKFFRSVLPIIVLTALLLYRIIDYANTHFEKRMGEKIFVNVYVNDEQIAGYLYKNFDSPKVEGPYNFGDYVSAHSVFDNMGIQSTVTDSQLVLASEKYGKKTFSLESCKKINEELYLEFATLRVYTDGSLKQEDYGSVHLFTSDFERADIPSTLKEAYKMLDKELSFLTKIQLRNFSEEDLIETHFGLGMWIRNAWLRPSQSKLLPLLVKNGLRDFDAMSSLIIKGYWNHLNHRPCELADLL